MNASVLTALDADPERASPQAPAARASEVIVIFDFDKTLVTFDTGTAFIQGLIQRSAARTALAAVLAPIAGPLLLLPIPITRLIGLSLFLWAATVGRGPDGFRELQREFGEAFGENRTRGRVIEVMVEALRQHVRAGHRVVVISGCFDSIVELILRRLVDGPIEVIGSRVRHFARGMIGEQHCIGAAKVRRALEMGLPDRPWDVGYSDSALDLHVLRRCKRRVLVNPSARTLAACRRALGDGFEVRRCD